MIDIFSEQAYKFETTFIAQIQYNPNRPVVTGLPVHL